MNAMLAAMSTHPHLDDLPPLRPMRLVEYQQLIDAGLLARERVELIDGQMVTMSPQGAPHGGVSAWLVRCLVEQLGRSWEIRSQSSLPLGDRSMPEPDVMVAPARAIGRPSYEYPRDTVLVVEVAESSIAYDTKVKARIYASAAIPTYWLVDLARRAVRVFTEPHDGAYTRVEVLEPGATLRAAGLDAVAIDVGALFPEADGG